MPARFRAGFLFSRDIMANYPPGRIGGGGPPRPPLPEVNPVTPPAPAPTPNPPSPPVPPTPAPSIVLIDVPPVGSRYKGTDYYSEILNRDPQPFTSSERPTNGHESCHGVNNRIRNQAGGRSNGFYVIGGKGIVVPEPNFTLTQVRPFIPSSLRGNRYKLYLEEQARDWDGQPTYIGDEWTAYIAGCRVAVQDYRAGTVAAADWLAGPVEFCFYALALGLACAKHDAASWQQGTLRGFIDFQLQKAGEAFAEGKDIKEFNFGQQNDLLEGFRSGFDAAELRAFQAGMFPAQGWLINSPLPVRGAMPRGATEVVTCTCPRRKV
jgi:hypothetical protein